MPKLHCYETMNVYIYMIRVSKITHNLVTCKVHKTGTAFVTLGEN